MLESGMDFKINLNWSGGDQLNNTIKWFEVITDAWRLWLPGSQAYGRDGHYNVRITYKNGEIERVKIYAHTKFYDPEELFGILCSDKKYELN